MAGLIDTLRLTAEEATGLLERSEVSAAELAGAYRSAISRSQTERVLAVRGAPRPAPPPRDPERDEPAR